MRRTNVARYEAGAETLTWAKFGTESGVAQATMYRIKENEGYRPGYDVLMQIAKYTEADVHELFDKVMGISPEERQDALELSEDVVQLSSANRNNIDRLLIEATSGNSEGAKGVLLVLLDLQQAVNQLTKQVALLRRQLQE